MANDSRNGTLHYRSCHLCEAICGLEIELREGAVRAIRGDAEDPFSRGHICAKAVALQDLHSDPDRLRRPVRRRGKDYEEIGWDEAFDEVGARLNAIRKRHGRDALASYIGNPAAHNWGTILYGPLLFRAMRTRHRYSATSVDQLPHHLASWAMFGHQMLLPVPDIDRTQFMLILGANPLVSNGSIMTAPGVRKRLAAIRERNGQVVVIDPRRTETARVADRHLFIRPGSDAYLLAGLLHVLYAEGLTDPGRLADYTDGLDRLEEQVRPFTPERVAAVTGIEADTISDLARQFAAAERAVAYGRMGVSVQEHGGLCQWLVYALNVVTGNLDRAGGAMFPTPAVDLCDVLGPGGFGRFRSEVRGLPEFGGELPVATLAEEILDAGDRRVRGLITIAGNPVLSTPNGRRLDDAFASLEFMASVDFYVNETTRHADIILPPTAGLEHDNYDIVFNHLAVRNTTKYSAPLFVPSPDTRHDWQILLALTRRVQAGSFMQRLKARLLYAYVGRLGPTGLLERFLKKGHRTGEVDLARLQSAPHGIDLGPLESCLPGRLKTSDKRLDVAPEVYAEAMRSLTATLESDARQAANGTMRLIGRRDGRSHNSWLHNYHRLVKGKPRCTLLLNPQDADRLGLADGDQARITSRVGAVEAPVQTSDEVMPGVASLPHGWGHDRDGLRLRVAAAHPGISVNDLTDHERVDALSGNAAFSGLPVSIAPV
jgi:anaerobic selenocysteine-containing dehydrogenase